MLTSSADNLSSRSLIAAETEQVQYRLRGAIGTALSSKTLAVRSRCSAASSKNHRYDRDPLAQRYRCRWGQCRSKRSRSLKTAELHSSGMNPPTPSARSARKLVSRHECTSFHRHRRVNRGANPAGGNVSNLTASLWSNRAGDRWLRSSPSHRTGKGRRADMDRGDPRDTAQPLLFQLDSLA